MHLNKQMLWDFLVWCLALTSILTWSILFFFSLDVINELGIVSADQYYLDQLRTRANFAVIATSISSFLFSLSLVYFYMRYRRKR